MGGNFLKLFHLFNVEYTSLLKVLLKFWTYIGLIFDCLSAIELWVLFVGLTGFVSGVLFSDYSSLYFWKADTFILCLCT